MSFETDNQDKSNLVGGVMSDAVDREQELIRVKTALSLAKEIIALKEEIIKNLTHSLNDAIEGLKAIKKDLA